MMDSLAFVPAALACGLAIGFLAGLWAHAHLYQHFLAKEEEKANRKIQRAVQMTQQAKTNHQEAIKRIKDFYGNDLSPENQQVISEEVEKVLGMGPNGR